MNDQNTSDPKLNRSQASHTPSVRPPSKVTPTSRIRKARNLLWALWFILLFSAMVVLGSLAGYLSGTQARVGIQTRIIELTNQEQYELGVQDLEAGRYEVARQRFEYILEHDPSYPGVTEKLAEAMAVLYATATPTPAPPSASPTPTFDPRPKEELFNQAKALVASQDWTRAIDTLSALRKEDRGYQVARVDGLLFMSLRNRGVDKIWKEGNLEGGLYDLSLAERFGPLDAQANSARELARLYTIGSSFWEVHPEQAVYYFGQVAAAAPGLRDASGWTANERHRASLIHYGDLLASQGDWCSAQTQYELALAITADAALQETKNLVALKCSPPSPTPELGTETATPTSTLPPGLTPTPTFTQGILPTETSTSTPQPHTLTPTNTDAAPPPTPTVTSSATPSPTPTDTPIPQPPTPTATFTSEPPPQGSSESFPGLLEYVLQVSLQTLYTSLSIWL